MKPILEIQDMLRADLQKLDRICAQMKATLAERNKAIATISRLPAHKRAAYLDTLAERIAGWHKVSWAKAQDRTPDAFDRARELGRAHLALYEGVRDMVDEDDAAHAPRLTRADIPDDYDWLIGALAAIEKVKA